MASYIDFFFGHLLGSAGFLIFSMVCVGFLVRLRFSYVFFHWMFLGVLWAVPFFSFFL